IHVLAPGQQPPQKPEEEVEKFGGFRLRALRHRDGAARVAPAQPYGWTLHAPADGQADLGLTLQTPPGWALELRPATGPSTILDSHRGPVAGALQRRAA